jgi:hypothetical protein
MRPGKPPKVNFFKKYIKFSKKPKTIQPINKNVLRETQDYIRYKEHHEIPGDERRFEDKMDLQGHFVNTATAIFNKIATEREEMRLKINETSQSINKLDTEFHNLDVYTDKRDKKVKQEADIKARLEKLKNKQNEQDKEIAGTMARKKELADLEKPFQIKKIN